MRISDWSSDCALPFWTSVQSCAGSPLSPAPTSGETPLWIGATTFTTPPAPPPPAPVVPDPPLPPLARPVAPERSTRVPEMTMPPPAPPPGPAGPPCPDVRSEERRVGDEGVSTGRDQG